MFAKECEARKELGRAEKIYLEMGLPEEAIKMYKNHREWEKMLSLFSLYRPDNLKNAHLLVAKKVQEEGRLG